MEKFVRKYSDARRGIVKTDAQIAMEAAKEKAALEASWNKKWYQPPADMLTDDIGSIYETYPYGKKKDATNL